jgi:4-hydroxyphenylacetate 3-monooxygenase
MGARTGTEYVSRLRESRRSIVIGGQDFTGPVPDHPAFSNVVQSYAALYDCQLADDMRDVLTYPSPSTGDPVGRSFMVPRTSAELELRRKAMSQWAHLSLGTLGRTGDYLNSCLMAMSEADAWFNQAGPQFIDNVRRYYEYVRENDLLLTHTLIPPQANRAQGGGQQMGGQLTARIVDQNDSGVVISGARMLATIGPTADELLVMPSTVLKGTPEDAPYSFALAVPCDAPGLRFICREPFDIGRSHFDHPLGSRFDEMDAVVVFDNVQVPFERCFLLGHPELCNEIYAATGAVVHMTHQVVSRTAAKTEAILGVVSLMTEAVGIEQFQHVQESVAEVITALEIVKGLTTAAEADASLNQHGVMTPAWSPLNAARNWYPKASQRFPEIIRKLGASGLMALPGEDDLAGPARSDIDRYLQSAALDAPERVRLFRLAWDMCASSFAGRQTLYEYFFFGDPVRMAGAMVRDYDRSAAKQRVREFLEQAPMPAATSTNGRTHNDRYGNLRPLGGYAKGPSPSV